MEGLDPERTFVPTLIRAFGHGEIIVVKEALGGMPIRLWVKDWEPAKGQPVDDQQPAKRGEIYDRLMTKVRDALKDCRPDTVTFVWMQGERDAREGHGEVYAESLKKLFRQLRTDLKRIDINVVIGQLSDFSVGNSKYQNWDEVRGAQQRVASEEERVALIDTDDWNGENNDLHYTKDGYDKLGEAFAEKALQLIKRFQKQPK